MGTRGGMQTARRHESDTQSIVGPCGRGCHSSAAEWETLCVHHANEQIIESRWKPAGLEIYSRSTHSDCRRLYVWVHVRRDGALTAVEWQFVTTLPQLALRMHRRCAGGQIHVQLTRGQQMPARMRRSHRDESTPNQRQAGNSSVCGSSCRHAR